MRTSFLSQLLLFAFFFIASCNENPKGVNNNKRDDNTNKNRNDNRDDNMDNNRDDNNNRDDSRYSLIGTWDATYPDTDAYENISVESSTMEFTRDGSWIKTVNYITSGKKSETKDHGNYIFNESRKTLVINSDEDEGAETADVEFLGKNKVILTIKGEEVTLVRN